MKRYHIAIFTPPANKAHMHPALGLCTELIKRGYRVTYPTNDQYASLVRESGAEPVIFTPPEAEITEEMKQAYGSLLPLDRRWWELYGDVYYPWLLTNAAVTVSTLEAFYKAATPDAILYDREAIGGRILAKLLGCRAIQILPHFAYNGSFRHWRNGVPDYPQQIIEFSEKLDSFLWNYGMPGRGNLWHIEDLNIYFIPRAFQYHGDELDDRRCFVGPCMNRSFRPLWKDRSGGRPNILITDLLGSADLNYFNMFIDALSGSRYQVILSVGENFPEDRLKALPSNFEINRHACHLEILQKTALFISQSGMGGTLEAIYYGVPVIALPLSPYHEEIAYRVTELGLGISLPRREMTSEMIRAGVEKALGDTALLSRVRDMQRVFRSCGGAVMAADKIGESLGIG